MSSRSLKPTKERYYANPLILSSGLKVTLPRFWKGMWQNQREGIVIHQFKNVTNKDAQRADAWARQYPSVVAQLNEEALSTPTQIPMRLVGFIAQYKYPLFDFAIKGTWDDAAKYGKCATEALHTFKVDNQNTLSQPNTEWADKVFARCTKKQLLATITLPWKLPPRNHFSPP